MNITSNGDRLNILITCDYSIHDDWMSFASWYSVYKNLPDAKSALLCARDLKDGYASYNWPYRCDISFFQHENVGKHTGSQYLNKLYATYVALKEGILTQPLLVADCDVMTLTTLSEDVLDKINDPDVTFGVSGPVWYFNGQSLETFVSVLHKYAEVQDRKCTDMQKVLSALTEYMGEPETIIDLCNDCVSQEPNVMSHYSNKCGRFQKKEWTRNMMYPPFGYTEELSRGVELTTNETNILKFWKKARTVYEAVR